jgi:hypothetical protein
MSVLFQILVLGHLLRTWIQTLKKLLKGSILIWVHANLLVTNIIGHLLEKPIDLEALMITSLSITVIGWSIVLLKM